MLTAVVGDWTETLELAERFRIGWERTGQLPRRGFDTTLSAAAMVCGLRGDDVSREWWLDVSARTRALPRLAGEGGAGPAIGYRNMFDAVLHLHRGQADLAVATMVRPPDQLDDWRSAVWRQWYAALWAEAAVMADRPDQVERLASARRITAGNPVAASIVDRAQAVANGALTSLPSVAAALAAAGCRYQQARTLVLAGGDHQTSGERILAAIGATPMA